MAVNNVGTSNPALDNEEGESASATAVVGSSTSQHKPHHSLTDWACLNNDTLSPDSEYDEALAFPDSVTIVSMGGDNPILVERDKDDEAESVVPDSEIPFTVVYKNPVKFNSVQRKVFIPGLDIHVNIVDNERNITTHLLNPNLYTIELTHGPFVWRIKKRYKHFYALHQQLRVFRTSLNIPFPTRTHKERRASFRNNYISTDNKDGKARKKRTKGALPRFPNKPETLVPVESLPVRIKQLEEYLYNLVNINLYKNHHETINFLEVSELSFVAALGEKGKEGLILKRTGSTRPGQSGCNCFGCCQNACCFRCSYFCSDMLCRKWRNRWFFVKDSFFGYMRPRDGSIRCIVLFDQGFEVSTGIYSTGMRNGLQILTYSRHIVVKTWTRRKAKEWMYYLKLFGNNQARDFTSPNPHNSFVPIRTACQASWFVDGTNYMSCIADALEGATEEIYIADWWLSPEIYMKRPALDGDYWRLDKILERKAEQGIKVFVLLYKEVEMALGINSYYSKQKLASSHEHIKVLRHPDHARVGVFLWAHHEKIVVIDQTYAFVGGIDLSYGRWDDYRHRLTDLGSIATASTSGSISKNDPLSLVRPTTKILEATLATIDITERKNLPALYPGEKLLMPSTSTIEEPCPENTKQNTPEMEKRNVLEKFKDNMKTKGKDFMHRLTSNDLVIESNSLPQSPTDRNKKYQVTNNKNMFFTEDELADGKKGDSITPLPPQNEILNTLDGQAKYWMGKDYTNFIVKDFTNLDAPYIDLVDRNTTPRMPWHDVGAVVVGSAARDISRHFIQRWNAVKLEKARDNPVYPYLIPKSYKDIKIFDSFLSVPLQKVSCQVLRSVSSWSCGFIEADLVEQSIHDAYIETITKAQHYIYIENQFFITLEQGNSMVRNQIGETLFKRIIRAHREKKVFRVYVVMPLLPGFEGDVGGNTGNALRAITHWNYASISRGKNSIICRLKAAGIDDPSQYISFHSLRTNSVLNFNPVTELIYVHSKLMIVDDKVVICGSANINDRSLIGKRDSEIAVMITDEVFQNGQMNGETVKSGLYAGSLRKFLFKEHLGLIDPDHERVNINVNDPTIDSFWFGQWQRTSNRNTTIYGEVFRCIPTNEVLTIAGMKKYLEEPSLAKLDPQSAIKEMNRIQGFLVDFPLKFLENEILTPPTASKEGIIPTSVWT